MKRFDAMVQVVAMLNHQLVAVDGRIDDEMRMLIQERLWAIIADFDQRLSLDLENHCPNLTNHKGVLCISFWTWLGSIPETEVKIFIDHHLSITRQIKYVSTGKMRIQKRKGSPPGVIWVEQ